MRIPLSVDKLSDIEISHQNIISDFLRKTSDKREMISHINFVVCLILLKHVQNWYIYIIVDSDVEARNSNISDDISDSGSNDDDSGENGSKDDDNGSNDDDSGKNGSNDENSKTGKNKDYSGKYSNNNNGNSIFS